MRLLALHLAARLEQEVRARPALYSSFYAVISRSTAGRGLVGRIKSNVRRHGDPSAPRCHTETEDEAVRARRDAAVAARLGLSLPEGAP